MHIWLVFLKLFWKAILKVHSLFKKVSKASSLTLFLEKKNYNLILSNHETNLFFNYFFLEN